MAQVKSRNEKICSVKNCYSTYTVGNSKIAFFQPKQDFVGAWAEIVGKPKLSLNSKICSIHFEEKCISKSKTLSNGQVVHLKTWKLVDGSLPSLHLDLPQRLRNKKVKNTNVQDENCAIQLPITGTVPHTNTNKSNINNKNMSKRVPLRSISNNESNTSPIADRCTTYNNMEHATPNNPDDSENNLHSFCPNATVASITVTKDSASQFSDEALTLSAASTSTTALGTIDLPNEDDNVAILNETPTTLTISALPTKKQRKKRTQQASNQRQITEGPCLKELTIEAFEALVKLVLQVSLPSSQWILQINRELKEINFIYFRQSGDDVIVKSVVVLSESTVSYYFNNRKLTSTTLRDNFSSSHELSDLLTKFHDVKKCNGLDPRTLKVLPRKDSYLLESGTIRHVKCSSSSLESSVCSACRKLKFNLIHNHQRSKAADKRKSKTTHMQAQRQHIQMQKHLTVAQMKIKKLKALNRRLKNETLSSKLEHLTLLVT